MHYIMAVINFYISLLMDKFIEGAVNHFIFEL